MGGTFNLACKVNKYMRSCVWKHRDKYCKLSYSHTAGGLVKNRCIVYEHQIFVVGSYEKHECAIQVGIYGLNIIIHYCTNYY